MKNKILKKIILVVSCVTVLVSAFVIPSFAASGDYTVVTQNSLNRDDSFYLGNNTLLFEPISLAYSQAFETDLKYYRVPFVDNISLGTTSYGTYQKDFDTFSSLFSISRVNRAYSVYETASSNYIYAVYDVGISTTSNQLSSDWGIRYKNLEFNFECNSQKYTFGDYHSFNNCIFLNSNNALGDEITYTYQVIYSNSNGEVKSYTADKTIKCALYPATNSLFSKGYTLYFNDIPSDIDYEFVWEVTFNNFRDENNAPADLTSSYTNLSGFGGNDTVIRYCYRSPIRTELNLDSDENLNILLGGVPEAEYNRGLDEGFDEGYDEGFKEGAKVGSSLSPFDTIIAAVNSFINWEFIPGVSVGIVLSIVIGVSLLIAFLKIFAGG